MKPVQDRPLLPQLIPANFPGLVSYVSSLSRRLIEVFGEYGFRVNNTLPKDGTEGMDKPLPLKSYAVADLPTASDWEGAIVHVSDETGGAVPAFSDGTNWRRCTDRSVAS